MKTIEKVYLTKKRSGNYLISTYLNSSQEFIGEFLSPRELRNKIITLTGNVIRSEYSKSQLKDSCRFFSPSAALFAFKIPQTKDNLISYFI